MQLGQLLTAVSEDAVRHGSDFIHEDFDPLMEMQLHADEGTFMYSIPDKTILMQQVEAEAANTTKQEMVDAFWRVLNGNYQTL